MLELSDKFLIDHVVERALKARKIDQVVLATTALPEDDVLADYVASHYSIKVHRGSSRDVRSRFLEIAKETSAEIVVRVTADDPFKDPDETDVLVDILERENLDYICNFVPQTLPIGLDVEAFTAPALFDSAEKFDSPNDKEHVTWNMRNQRYKWRSHSPQTFRPEVRLTVDNLADLEYCSEIADVILQNSLGFSLNDTRQAIEHIDRKKNCEKN
jgi:spore coat polysaccharide biosynthesis protein SpsF